LEQVRSLSLWRNEYRALANYIPLEHRAPDFLQILPVEVAGIKRKDIFEDGKKYVQGSHNVSADLHTTQWI
jgi:hypothetical protein